MVAFRAAVTCIAMSMCPSTVAMLSSSVISSGWNDTMLHSSITYTTRAITEVSPQCSWHI